jgi:competence protein ComEC
MIQTRKFYIFLKKMISTKIKKIASIVGVFAFLTTVFVFSGATANDKDLEVALLDVGQGDASLIKTPFGQNIIVDGGPDNAVIEELSNALPWWDRTIDLLVLTHPHDDHLNGQLGILERFDVKKILYSGVAFDSPAYLEWKKQINDKKIPLLLVERPQTIVLGENCRLNVLYPDRSLIAENIKNLNNSSIVMKLVYGENSFLFTGDAESEVENVLLQNKYDLDSQIIKLAHHGSDTSSSEKFLQAVKPAIAIVSVGVDNDFGHPSLRILNRLKRLEIKTLMTSTDGSLRFFCDGQRPCELDE